MSRIPYPNISHMKKTVAPQKPGARRMVLAEIIAEQTAKLTATGDPETPRLIVEKIPQDRFLRKMYDRHRREERNFASWVVLQISQQAGLEAQIAIEEFYKSVPEVRFQRFLSDLGVLGCKVGPVA